MLPSIFGKTLWDQRRSLLWGAIGLGLVVFVYVPVYPSYRDAGLLEMKDAGLPEDLATAMGFDDLASPAGYLEGTLFGLLGPLLLIMFAAATGARAIAGDEEAGMLDLLLAHPVSRTRLVLERFGALAAAIALLGSVVWVATLAAISLAGIDIGADRITAAAVGLALLGLSFGAIALATGAISGSRGLVLGVTAALAVAAYLTHSFAPQVEGLEPLRNLSPFYYCLGSDPLRTGFHPGHLAMLEVIPLALLGIALWSFNGRDVAV